MRILVHQSHAGALIGKGGARIRDLRESSGCQMKVFATCAPQSTDRIVLVAGGTDKVLSAVKSIHDALADVSIKGVVRQYDSGNWDPSYASEYGGLVAGRGGDQTAMMGRQAGVSPPYSGRYAPAGGQYHGALDPAYHPANNSGFYADAGAMAVAPPPHHHQPYGQQQAYGGPPPMAGGAPPQPTTMGQQTSTQVGGATDVCTHHCCR